MIYTCMQFVNGENPTHETRDSLRLSPAAIRGTGISMLKRIADMMM